MPRQVPRSSGQNKEPQRGALCTAPPLFTSACLDRNQIHQLLRKGKSLGQFFSFFEMKDLVCLLLINRMISTSPQPHSKNKKSPEIIRNGCTPNKYHQIRIQEHQCGPLSHAAWCSINSVVSLCPEAQKPGGLATS